MDERIPTNYQVTQSLTTRISLRSESDDAVFTLECIRDNIFRVTFTTSIHPLPLHPSILEPKVLHSRAPQLSVQNGSFVLSTNQQISVMLHPHPTPVLCVYLDGVQLYSDLPNRSYVLDGNGSSRYARYDPGTLYLGLGERAAPFDLSNRTFALSALDAAEYDAHHTDPLYKHIPFLIRATSSGCVGVFSTSHSRGTWSVGGEIDALWGRYEVMRQNYGGLELYLIVARSLKSLVKSYADLAGYPRMIPRWALGYLASSMGYAESDNPPAQELLSKFPELCKQHDVPCSAIHLSSGYTVSMEPPKTRNVFTINTHRFPDPTRLFKQLSDSGVRTIANIKPYVLMTHPAYQTLVAQGAFFETAKGEVAVTRLWSAGLGESGCGSWLDMTSNAAQEWWYKGVKGLLELGVSGIWNDNNEFGLLSDKHLCAGYESRLGTGKGTEVGSLGRLVNTEIMAKISFQALSDTLSDQRTYLLTRCATVGTMRYANSSWSGDNVTSWDTMCGNNAMGLTAGLCLIQSYGHDCGGFAGPRPSPQLFLRWVQLATLLPRFTIHSWKPTEQDPSSASNITEPWMYPPVLPQIRDAIKRRYELIPYLYELHFRSSLEAEPIQRWTGWGPYDQDEIVWNDGALRAGEKQFFLGDAFIVGGVYGNDIQETKVYLPTCKDQQTENSDEKETYYDDGFISLHAPYQHFLSGQWVTVPTPLSNIAVLARVGCVVPVGRPCVTTASPQLEPSLTRDDWRGVEIYPAPLYDPATARTYTGNWREDDGVSTSSGVSEFSFCYEPNEDNIRVRATCISKGFNILWDWKLWIILPVGEQRHVVSVDELSGAMVQAEMAKDARGRLIYQIHVTLSTS